MSARSMATKVALAAVAAAAVVTVSAPPAGAVAAPAGPSVSSANAAELAVTPAPISLVKDFDLLDQGETNRVTVNVPAAGKYVVSYFVSYPDTAGRLRTVVDGKKLPDTVSPADPGTFGVVADSKPFTLRAGTHTFRMTGVKVPSSIGVNVYLIAASTS
jgi:hypothetical protein